MHQSLADLLSRMATPRGYKKQSKESRVVSNGVKKSTIENIDASIINANHRLISEVSRETTRRMIDNAAASAILEAAHRIGTKRIDKNVLYETAMDIFGEEARQFERDVDDMLVGEFDYIFEMIVEKGSK